ncbi:hypothetical protein BaRGS_00030134 [Batillaria attramentaria]|uniref:Phorbol-ester/DAG-type domain-containing protein n=1 Tax=Batillaria attramentaria TaxID=370345 RepID=A0ABD0JUF2_9CAEN
MAHVVDTSIAAVKMSGGFSAPDFSSSDEEEDILSRPRSNAVSQSDLGVSESTGVAFVPRSYGSGSDVLVSPKSQSGTDVIVDGSNTQSLSDDHDAKTKKNPSVQTRSDHDRIVSSEKSSASLSDDHPANKQCVIRKQSHAPTSADCQQRLGRDQAGLKGSASVTDNDQTSSPEILSSESSPVMVTQCSAQASKNQPAVNGSLSYASGTSAGSSSSLPEYYQQSRFNPFDCDIHLEEDHFSDNARDTYFANLSDPWQDGVQPVEESDKVTFAELGLAEDHFAHPEGHFGLSRTEELELAISNCKELIQSAAPNSDRQKNLVRKLVQLRLKLQEIKEGPEPVEKDKVVVMGHRFQRKESRSSKYYCEKCNSIIWGVLQEWRRCTECGYRCHDKCVSQITRTCASVKVKENPTFILELCPRNPKGLAAQDFRCAECRAQISGKFSLPVDVGTSEM